MWNRQKDSKCYHEVNVLWNLYRCILTIFMIFRYLWGHNSFREEERLNNCLNNCLGAVFNSNVIMYCKFVADRQVHWCCICIYYQIITDFFRFSGFIYNYCVHVYIYIMISANAVELELCFICWQWTKWRMNIYTLWLWRDVIFKGGKCVTGLTLTSWV